MCVRERETKSFSSNNLEASLVLIFIVYKVVVKVGGQFCFLTCEKHAHVPPAHPDPRIQSQLKVQASVREGVPNFKFATKLWYIGVRPNQIAIATGTLLSRSTTFCSLSS